MSPLVRVRKAGLPYRRESKALMEQMLPSDACAVTWLSQRLGKSYGAVSNGLSELERKGRVEKVRPGTWRLTERGRSEAENFKGSVPPPAQETKVTQSETMRVSPLELDFRYRDGKAPADEREGIDWQREFVALAHEIAKGRQ